MKTKYLLDLHQFDDAGEDAAAGVAAAQAETTGTDDKPGTGQPATGESETEDLEADFDSLISGKYAKQFQDRTQKAIGRRMSSMQKDLQKAKDENGKLMRALSTRYGMANATADQLLDAVNKDESFLEEAAMREGLSVEQYRKMADMQTRLSEAEREKEEADKERFREQYRQELERQEEECRQQFPDFDLDREYHENETFQNMMRMGAKVIDAYKFAHMNDIMASGMAKAAQRGAERTANAVRSNLSRPAEAGARNVSAATIGTDWANMSSEDFRAYQEKLMAGG